MVQLNFLFSFGTLILYCMLYKAALHFVCYVLRPMLERILLIGVNSTLLCSVYRLDGWPQLIML